MDSTVRDSLERCLPETEPPMRLQLQDVIKRGRRRRRIRTLAPAGAAVVVALMVGSVFATVGPPPPPAELPPAPPTPIVTSSVPTTGQSSTPTSGVPTPPTGQQPVGTPSGMVNQPAPSGQPGSPATSGTSVPNTGTTSAQPPPPSLQFRAPSGHQLDGGAQILTDLMVTKSFPAERIAAKYGTRSDDKSLGDRYIFGGHLLWQEGPTFGYLYWLHRTVGDFPVTGYGLPTDPCVDPTRPAPGERCEVRPLPNGEREVLFDIDRGYRLRGVVQYWKDPAGVAPDMAVTYGFYLPQLGGAWPQFPGVSGQRPLPSIPYTAAQLSQIMTANRL